MKGGFLYGGLARGQGRRGDKGRQGGHLASGQGGMSDTGRYSPILFDTDVYRIDDDSCKLYRSIISYSFSGCSLIISRLQSLF